MTALDGLRGIAILLVLSTHLLPHRPTGSVLLRVLNAVAGIGWSGVDIFFVLSGFLITGILYDSRRSDHFFRNFYMRRTLRIAPLYLLLVTCCVVIFPHFAATQGSAPSQHHWMFWVYLSNILVAFRGVVSVGWLGPLWSLAVEEHFYLIWPAVIFFLSRKTAMQACVACVFLAHAVRMWFLGHNNLLGAYVFTLSRFDELALGALVALAIRRDCTSFDLRISAKRAAIGFGIATTVLFVWRHGVILDSVMLGVGLPVVGALSTAALMLAVLPGVANPWKAFLNLNFLRQFGRYSYGLYMLHMPVWELMHQHHLVFRREERIFDVANLFLAVATTFVVAFISFHLFESPFLRLKRFFEPDRHPSENKVNSSLIHDPAMRHSPIEARS